MDTGRWTVHSGDWSTLGHGQHWDSVQLGTNMKDFLTGLPSSENSSLWSVLKIKMSAHLFTIINKFCELVFINCTISKLKNV